MAPAVEVDRWSADGVRLGEVAAALGALRDPTGAGATPARTAVLTLVAVAGSDDDAHGASEAMLSLAGQHPARIILIRTDPDSVAHLAARTTLYALERDGHRVHFEEVSLEVGGQASLHLDSVVEAFTLSDLPVVVWYAGSLPDAFDPLVAAADAVLVDTRGAPDPGALRALLQLARRRTVVDLGWSRLRPWRELLAGLFDPPSRRPLLEELSQVSVAGKPGPRRLAAGWVVGQTGVALRRVTMADARHLSLVLSAGPHRFRVARVEGQRRVEAEAVIAGEPTTLTGADLPEHPLPSSLADALAHLRPDPVWERALAAATALE